MDRRPRHAHRSVLRGLLVALALLVPGAAEAAVSQWEGTLTLTVDMSPVGGGVLQVPLTTSGAQDGFSTRSFTFYSNPTYGTYYSVYMYTATLQSGGLTGSGSTTGSVNAVTPGILPPGVSSARWNLQKGFGLFDTQTPFGAGSDQRSFYDASNAATFAGTSTVLGFLGGKMPLAGNATFALYDGGLLDVPIEVIGSPGASISATASTYYGSARLKAYGNGWADGPARAKGSGSAGTATLTTQGYDHREQGGSGTLQLVTPFLVRVESHSNTGYLPGIGVLNVSFVPEPGTALLLGSGVAGLALFGRRRWRR